MASIELYVRTARSTSEAFTPSQNRFSSIDGYQLDSGFELGSARDSFSESVTHEFGDHDICQVELIDGTIITVTPEEFDNLQNKATPTAQRGLGRLIFRAIAFFKPTKKDVIKLSANVIARKVEHKLIKGGAKSEGVYQVSWEEQSALEKSHALNLSKTRAISSSEQPALLFIHGTFSSTEGSFGGLGSSSNQPIRQHIEQTYGKRIYSLEHRTLISTPVANAITVLKALPKNATIHLITHSRGGIVGDLLASYHCDGERLSFDKIKKVYLNNRGSQALAEKELTELEEFFSLLEERKPIVTEFLRCACPIMGTALLQQSQGLWLSALTITSKAASKLIPQLAIVAEAVDMLSTLIAGARRLATEIPGLEAMRPDSPLLRCLNIDARELKGRLTVISGEAQPGWNVGRAALELLSKLAFDGRSDWVVDTRNMFGGFKRSQDNAWFHLEESSDIHHLCYFDHGESSRKISLAIKNFGMPSPSLRSLGFSPIDRSIRDGSNSAVRGKLSLTRDPNKPAMFLLPGIMGSYLKHKEEEIWIDISSIAVGELKKLSIDAQDVSADGPVRLSYGKAIKYFGKIYNVIDQSFDWRLPITDSSRVFAEALKKEIQDQIDSNKRQPIYILAHSMGGLVARGVGIVDKELWTTLLNYEPGFRFVMLGTPNGGSHSIVKVLTGYHKLVNRLAFLDFTQSKKEVINLVGQFPGLVNLLPDTENSEWFSDTHWASLKQAASKNKAFVIPSSNNLDITKDFYRQLKDVPLFVNGIAKSIYIAGKAKETPISVQVNEKNKLTFITTPEGDSAVPWKSGIPDDIPVWYVDEPHGNLAACKEYFPAFKEIFETGFTSQLSSTPLGERRDASHTTDSTNYDEDEVYFIPTEEDLSSIFGASHAVNARPSSLSTHVNVRVVHGNLKFVNGVMCVGHYEGDTVVGAESALDECLDGQLTLSRDLGTYPGKRNTARYFENSTDNDHGLLNCGLVIGLGTVGSLSPGALKHTFANGLVQLLENHHRISTLASPNFSSTESAAQQKLRVSTLIIGSSGGGVSVRASLEALLAGLLLANERVKNAHNNSDTSYELVPQITSLDFVELYRDTAIKAQHAISDLVERTQSFKKYFSVGELGDIGAGWERPFQRSDYDWWQRMDISKLQQCDSSGSGTNSFLYKIVSNRSGASEFKQSYQSNVVESMISQAINRGNHNHSISNTLFEVLLPSELKDFSFDDRDLMLVLDSNTAHIPWELMDDKENLDIQPVAVRSGLIRQLSDPENQITPRYALEDIITIVGDPRLDLHSDFVPLGGAKREAQLVTKLFKNANFKCVESINEDGIDVISKVVNTNAKVLHLAGHGVYSEWDEQLGEEKIVSGMVLNDGCYLNADLLSGRRMIPELVFINCCHLGKIGSNSELAQPKQPHLLAASISRELINMGVKAIVAAGWSVDDRMAEVFSEVFYTEMLENKATFGEAIKAARRATYEFNPLDNTWGAYQCYGDPSYQLRITDSGKTPGKSKVYTPYRFATLDEVTLKLKNIRSVAKAGGNSKSSSFNQSALIETIDRIKASVAERGWLHESVFLSELGMAYGELGRFKEAIQAIKLARSESCSELSHKVLDHLASFQSHLAIHIRLNFHDALVAADKGEKTKIKESFKEELAYADRLFDEANNYLQTQLITRNREPILYNYAASTLKYEVLKKAESRSTKKPTEILERISELHSASSDNDDVEVGVKPHAGLSRATAELLVYWTTRKSQRSACPKHIKQLLNEVTLYIETSRLNIDQSFWDRNDSCYLQTLGLLAETSDRQLELPNYRFVVGSKKQFTSIRDHLRYISIVLAKHGGVGKSTPRARIEELLSEVNSLQD
ncbi:hypothetical protein NBRC116583_02780 [Arenicella sp. 4NH20-0111]|uniref:DUF7379 domain-containing protein n=1 Tax=Arenicella sp. 4NH20-0111 TaxID=3127648 RepID=UPI003107ACB5